LDVEDRSDVVLRRPKKSILTAKVSIPRVSIDNCDKCGHRVSKRSEIRIQRIVIQEDLTPYMLARKTINIFNRLMR
jgi:hypothetical protein